MKLEQTLTELQHIELSHFRQLFGIVGYGVCVINSSYSFQWIILKPCRLVADILKMCKWIFADQKIMLTKSRLFDLDNFEVSLQHRIVSLCNQLLLGFSSNQFETLHISILKMCI